MRTSACVALLTDLKVTIINFVYTNFSGFGNLYFEPVIITSM